MNPSISSDSCHTRYPDDDEVTSRFHFDHPPSPSFIRSSDESKDPSPDDHPDFLQTLDSASVGWTDDKHSSYLDSVEADFVRNMYDREFCSVDVCGHAPECTGSSELDCNESQSPSFFDGAVSCPAEFKAWRNGGWQAVAFERPPLVKVVSSAAVLRNPWIQHFRHSTSARSSASTSGRQFRIHTSLPSIKDHEVEKLPLDQGGVERTMEKGVRLWQKRLRLKPSVMKDFKRDARFLSEGACKRLRKIQQLYQGLPSESAYISEMQKQEQESKFVSGPLSSEMKSSMEHHPAVRSVMTEGQCYDECLNTRQVYDQSALANHLSL